MLQLLYLDISKVERVFQMGCMWKVAGGVGDVRDGACSQAHRAKVVTRSMSMYHPTLAPRIRRLGASKSIIKYSLRPPNPPNKFFFCNSSTVSRFSTLIIYKK
jgi:hypothetical protein